MDNNSTYVPGMNNSANSDINPYAQPNAGSGTVIPGMQPNRVPTPEPPATPQANGAPVVGFLYSISNGGNREYWPIHVGTNIIGREDSADITLREATVSSRHAEIRVRELRTGNGLTATIQDLGSKTGILINDTGKRIRDASVYGQKISPKFLFLSDIFLFPFVRQQVPVLAWRCSRRQRRCLVDDVRYIFKEVDALQPA